MKHARAWLLALLAACGAPRPVALPAAPVEVLVPVDDHSALVFMSGDRRYGWLARVDRDGRPLWVRPLPEFMATVNGHDPESTRIVADGEHGALRLTEFAADDDPIDHWLGFSLLDGALLWHQHLGHAGAAWAEHGHLFRRRAGADGDTLEVRDLATGALGFTHDLSRPYGDDTQPVIAAFADAVALPDASRGVVLRRASDGLLRASFAIRGDFCRVGDTLVGLRDDDLVIHDPAALRSGPRVLARGLADVLPDWLDQTLVACHVRGDGTVLEFSSGVLTRLVTLGSDGRPSLLGAVLTTSVLGRELGDSVPGIRKGALILRPLTGDFAGDARRMEPVIHAVTYDDPTPFDGGYLASHASDDGLDLLSLDIDGAVTGAARILGRPLVTPARDRDDQLWLVDPHARGATLGLRVLDLPSLRSLGGTAFTIVDRTAEAQAAWLPPPPSPSPDLSDALRLQRGPGRELAGPPLFAPGSAPPEWPHAAVTAVAQAQGVRDPPELLGWSMRAALFVAHGSDAQGPRWSFVAVVEREDGWADGFNAAGYPHGGLVLRRRPTRTDVELRLRALGWSPSPAPGYDWYGRSYRVDLRRYVGLTFASPRRPTTPGR